MSPVRCSGWFGGDATFRHRALPTEQTETASHNPAPRPTIIYIWGCPRGGPIFAKVPISTGTHDWPRAMIRSLTDPARWLNSQPRLSERHRSNADKSRRTDKLSGGETHDEARPARRALKSRLNLAVRCSSLFGRPPLGNDNGKVTERSQLAERHARRQEAPRCVPREGITRREH
jgi:hypothetical protein